MKNSYFVIIRPNCEDSIKYFALKNLLKRSDDNWIKYDFLNGTKELANRKFNLNLKIYANESRDICSDYVSRYALKTKVVYDTFEKLSIAFPQDYLRFLNVDKTIILN